MRDIHYVLNGANGVPILQKMLCKFGLVIPIPIIKEVFMKPKNLVVLLNRPILSHWTYD